MVRVRSYGCRALSGLLCLVSAGIAAEPGASTPAPRAPIALQPNQPAIKVVQSAPVTVVYLEHTGPYWTVRGRLREVLGYMRDHGLSGEVYVRYRSSPIGSQAARTTSEVGFVATGDHQPTSPFLAAKRGAEWVASMTVESTGSIAPHHYRELNDWITANGYVSLGPLVERYPQGFSDRADGRSAYRVVLQMPIQPPVASGATVAAPPVPQPPEEPAPGEAVPSAAAERVVDEPAAPRAAEPVAARPAGSVDEGSKTIAELLKLGQVDAIARRLMLEGVPIPSDADLWLGQIVFRISAAAKGIERTFPGEGSDVAALAAAIKERYRQASSGGSGKALEQVVVRVDSLAGPTAQQRRAVLQDLDRLLARIAARAVDAEGAEAAIAAGLEEVAAMLKSTPDPVVTDR